MATTVGQHSISAFATPVNGGPLDANVVRGNDNTIRTAYVDHDADPGIHVQSSTLASRPAAGTAGRKWITNDNDVYTLWFDDGSNWHPVSSENVALTVLATTALTKGDVVKVTGWNNGQDLAEVAKVASASDVAFAVMSADVSINTMGYATNTGLLLDFNTNSFNVGDILYPNTSGGFTATKPTSGHYQPCAYVLRKNANNGVLYVEFSAPRIVERSDNTASTIVLRDASGNFAAGTITAGALTSTGLVTFASLKGTGATTVTDILNDSTMATASATTLATSSSIKTYVDNKVATVDTLAEVLANGNTSGANNLIISSGQKIQTPTVAALDGTSSATIADSTGVMTIASSVLTTTDINGGTIDGTIIGGASAAAGTFTTVAGTTGNITTVNATTVDTTNIEVTNVKAKDGTASIAIADSTGVATISAAPILSALTASQAVFTDASKGLVSNAITGTGNVVMSASPTLTGTIGAANMTLSGTLGVTSTATFTTPLADSNLATISTAGKVSNSATTAASANTASAIVARDGSGNFTAGTITAALTGNASTATKLATARAINGVNFDGSADITVTAAAGTLSGSTLASGVTASSLTSVGTLSSLTVSGKSLNERVVVGTSGSTNDTSGTAATLQLTNGPTALITSHIDAYIYKNPSAIGDTLAHSMVFQVRPNGIAGYSFVGGSSNATLLRLDGAGNLGLGVTPSAWKSTWKVLDIGTAASVYSQDNNTTGVAANLYFNGTNWVRKNLGFTALYQLSDGAHYWYSNGSGAAGSTFTPGSVMTLDASGNLGVGAISPTQRLDVRGGVYVQRDTNGTSGVVLALTNQTTSSNNGCRVSFDSYNIGAASIGIPSDSASLAFYVNGATTERARITSGGYFKASNSGTYQDSSAAYHELMQTATGTSVAIVRASSTSYASALLVLNCPRTTTNGTYNFIEANHEGVSARFVVADSGNVTNTNNSYGAISDAKVKQDIVDAASQWDDLKAVRVRKFRYTNDPEGPLHIGVVAQEIEAVSPGLIDSAVDYEDVEVTDEDGNVTTERQATGTVTKSVKYSVLYMKAIGALQEAMTRIEALEARLEALEA